MSWVKIADASEVAEGTVRVVSVGSATIALARAGGAYYALDNVCPHAGGSLGDGYVVRGVVHCGWHEWPFELSTGRCVQENACVRTYPVRLRENAVEVDLGPAPAAG